MRILLSVFSAILLCFVNHTQAIAMQTNEGLIIADGFGASDISQFPLEAQAKMMAKRAAQVDAQRNLAEQIKGLRLTGGTTMEDFEVSSDIVATRVKAVLKGAFELEQKVSKEDGSILVELKMAVCVNNFSKHCKDRPTLENIVVKPDPEQRSDLSPRKIPNNSLKNVLTEN